MLCWRVRLHIMAGSCHHLNTCRLLGTVLNPLHPAVSSRTHELDTFTVPISQVRNLRHSSYTMYGKKVSSLYRKETLV